MGKIMLEVEKEKHNDEIMSLRQELNDMRHNIHEEWKKLEENGGIPKSPSKGSFSSQEGPSMEVLKEKDEYIKNLEDELELVTEQLIESNDETARLMLKF